MRLVELLLKLTEDTLLVGMATVCLGAGVGNTPLSGALEPLMQDLESSDPDAYEDMVDALLWGVDNRRLGAVVDDARWCEALGAAVCELDMETSTGDWCLGNIVSAEGLLSTLGDDELGEQARKAVMAAVADQCQGIVSDDAVKAEQGAVQA